MSRELLKRALRFMEVVGCSNDDICQLCDEIPDELAKPEPEPLCYLSDKIGTTIFEQCEFDYGPSNGYWTPAIPVYAPPPPSKSLSDDELLTMVVLEIDL